KPAGDYERPRSLTPSPGARSRAVRMFADRLEQQRPIDAVEIALDVDIEHPVVPPASLTSLPEGLDRRPAGSVSVRVRMENRFQSGLQIPFDDLLGDSVADRRNSQRPSPSIVLRNVDPPNRRRKIAP